MSYTRIKICGITRPDDAILAAELGVDAIGLNFVAGPRRITFIQARDIIADVPPFVSVVALLSGEDPIGKEMAVQHRHEDFAGSEDVMRYTNYLQLYSRPSRMTRVLAAANAGWFVRRNNYWPVVHLDSREALSRLSHEAAEQELLPSAILFDTASPTKLGGTGQSFNWNWIADARAAGELEGLPPIILAGGLNPDNVAEAIRIARPYAVDVSSGVEFPNQPGVKDPARVKAFIQAVRSTQ